MRKKHICPYVLSMVGATVTVLFVDYFIIRYEPVTLWYIDLLSTIKTIFLGFLLILVLMKIRHGLNKTKHDLLLYVLYAAGVFICIPIEVNSEWYLHAIQLRYEEVPAQYFAHKICCFFAGQIAFVVVRKHTLPVYEKTEFVVHSSIFSHVVHATKYFSRHRNGTTSHKE